MSTLHRCLALGCREKVKAGFLMCRPHWRLVPKDLQQVITEEYQTAVKAREAATSPRYRRAVLDAIKAVQKGEGNGPIVTGVAQC